MKKKLSTKINSIIFCGLFLVITGCSRGYERIMPFYNYEYSASRLMPLRQSNSKYGIRFWINYSTSIDRIISVSKDSSWGTEANIIEFGKLSKKQIWKKDDKIVDYYSIEKIIPKSGFDKFISKVNSLNLFDYQDRPILENLALHEPSSLFIIEIKKDEKYHSFIFRGYITEKKIEGDKYQAILKLINDEFYINFKINFK